MNERTGGETMDMEKCLKFYSYGNPIWLFKMSKLYSALECLCVQISKCSLRFVNMSLADVFKSLSLQLCKVG